VERHGAHRILTEHAPERDPRWLWLRQRCVDCHEAYPCMLRRDALAELAAGVREHPDWSVVNNRGRLQ
jgi:hypothetical protein